MTERSGTNDIIFGYNGRDGVVTDNNGLIYMRARYYSPAMRRFINADILHGEISDSTSLNRYSYVNGNPVSFVDPFGLSKERGSRTVSSYGISPLDIPKILADAADGTELILGKVKFVKDGKYINIKGDSLTLQKFGIKQRRIKASNVDEFKDIATYVNPKLFDAPGVILDVITIGINVTYEVSQYETSEDKRIIGTYTAATDTISAVTSAGATWLTAKAFATFGTTIMPGLGTLVGLGVGYFVGLGVDAFFDWIQHKYIDDIVENN